MEEGQGGNQATLKLAFADAKKRELRKLCSPFANSLLGVHMHVELSKRIGERNKTWQGCNHGEWVSNIIRDRFYEFIYKREQSLQASAKNVRRARKDAVAGEWRG